MNKHQVLGEIKGFLEGYNEDIKYLVNVETDPRTNYAECIIHEPNHEPRIEKIRYEPFMYMKDLSRIGRILYANYDESYIESKKIKYGITITKLNTGNQQRLLDGYYYKITSHRSYNDIINYIRDGGIDIFEKLTDELGNFVRDNKGKFVYRNRDLFHSVKTTEQFFISTQSRLYKGYEQYKEVHRLTYDIETTGLRYQIARMFAIGVRDNRGFEQVLEIEKNDDESEIRLIQDFFNLIDLKKPAVIVGHNSEDFDFEFILGRAKILKMDLTQVPNGLKEGVLLKRKGNTSVKYGNTTDKYTSTEMWGYSFIDTLHAAKRTAAVNSDLKRTNLKYIAKFENFARKNRTYIKGEDNDIGKFYNENNVFLINEKNEYIELPPEFQEVGRNLYKLQVNKDNITDEQYKTYKAKFLNDDKLINNEKTFVDWFKENCIDKKLTTFLGGKKLVHQYLLDDLWETEQVDELYNQSSFMLAKIVPTVYQRICTMGTASIWNLLLTAWSYENDLAIPIPDKFEKFGGGLARTYKKGYSTKIIKIDYASLYPMIQLTHGVFPMFDITGVMQKMLLYMTTTRNIYKKMGAGAKLDNEELGLLKQVDHEAHDKYLNDKLIKEDIAMFKVKQLPIKILNNSLYGALGSHISFNWSDNICAAWITSVARLELRHAIHWFSQFGCIALLAVTDGVNFKIPDFTHIIVNENGVDDSSKDEAPIDEMWIYGGKTGINALIEYFNDTEMPKPYMSVDNDGESISCLNLARINYAMLSETKDKKTGEVKEKIKLTGNTLKSKVMPEYIQEFIDKGLDLILHGKGKEFVEYYYSYAEDIRYMQIPLKKIASKSKVKQTLKAYKNRGTDKNGKAKASQAHMELLIQEREKIALELFEKHKIELGFDSPEKEPKKIDDIMKVVINYMLPEPELDSTVYYVNTGERKSHGDVKKDKDTGEIELRCKLISAKDLEENPDMTGEYNYERYLDAFNKRVCYSDKKIGALLSAFEPEVAEKIPIELVKKGENAGDLIKGDFNPLKNELELKSFDLDDFDESMHLSEKEVDFWNKTGYDPRLVWDGFKMRDDYKVHYEIYENALNFLNSKLEEKGDKLRIKSVNDDYQKDDLVLIKNNSNYSLGVYNGIYMKIIRDNIEIPKSEIEIELDRINEENQKKNEELKSSELITKSDREIFLEAQAKKRQEYFKEFKQVFCLDLTYTMEKLFTEIPEAKGAFDMYIQNIENEINKSVEEYLGVDEETY
jgi:DNA polymerase elongation subunit (family B)